MTNAWKKLLLKSRILTVTNRNDPFDFAQGDIDQ